ncbi:NAD(P)/FAD-dependent oxidoreductase [Rhodospirillaceae bacterium SYSU D60014]|uniref:NAD(P)/FAD-dependent oxidoreductase n=1 Tax=Virgifigura deserti TaxID=2268457 RepID=UPI000E669F5C
MKIAEAHVTADFKETPYWWEAAPLVKLAPVPVPARVDVAIVGGGLTGLNAARILARAGRSVAVFEAGDPGEGASSRNAGYVARTLKHSFLDLERQHGLDYAVTTYKEMQAAFDSVRDVIRDERIDCQFRIDGRYMPTASPAHYESMARELEARRRHLGSEFEMVPRRAQHRELATDLYHGGAVMPDLGGLHPGLYYRGLLDRARKAGATVVANTRVTGIDREPKGGGFTLATARGATQAREVIVATNGYTGRATPWLARRVVPFNGYMVATEPLPAELIGRVLPKDRTCIDSNHDPNFVRRSPDGERLLFGGLTGRRTDGLWPMAARLQALLERTLPDLKGVKLSHAWTGLCAGTFDFWPHVGARDGLHFAMGYNFAGVPMGTYLGQKVALKILGSPEARTVFDRPFPTVPLYTGNPWFVPQVMRVFNWLDRWDARRGPSK